MTVRRKFNEFTYISLTAILSLVNDFIWFVLFTPIMPSQIMHEDSLQPELLRSVAAFTV